MQFLLLIRRDLIPCPWGLYLAARSTIFCCLLTCLRLKLADIFGNSGNKGTVRLAGGQWAPMFWGDEIHSLSVCVRASEQRQQGYNSIIGCFRAENGLHLIQHNTRNTLVDLFSSLHVLSAWKQIAAVTAALQQSVRNGWIHRTASPTSGRNS